MLTLIIGRIQIKLIILM